MSLSIDAVNCMQRQSWRQGGLRHLLSIALLVDVVVAGSSAFVADAEVPCPLISTESRALGIDIVNDPACGVAPDPSLSCITSRCRFCQAEPTPYSFEYYPCSPSPSMITPTSVTPPSQLPSAECAVLVSPTETAAGLRAAEDVTCATSSMGCLSASCRLCRLSDDAAGLDAFRSCTELQSASASSIAQSQAQEVCGMQVSANQAKLGIDVVTDAACEEGSPGCLGVCRYCKLPESTVTGLNFCPSAIATAVATEEPLPTTVSTNSQLPTNATGTSTTSSVTPCDVTLPALQQQVGLDVVTDSSCANVSFTMLFGCFNPSCRLCKRFDSEYTGDLHGCEAITSSTSGTVNSTATSENATDASVIVESTCSMPSPPGASELGLFVVTDVSCASDTPSGFGCLNAACRVCKVYDTTLTSSLPFCETGQVDVSDAQSVESSAKNDDKAGSGIYAASLSEDGGGRAHGGVTSLLSTSGMIAVVLGTALVSTIATVGIKRMITRRTQRQLEAASNSKHGGHIAV